MMIRSATPDDAAALAQVHIDSWRSAYRGLVPDSYLAGLDHARNAERFRQALAGLDHARNAQRFRQSLAEGAEETYLAEEGGEVLGFLTIGGCRDDDVDRGQTGEIWGIYLAPAFWRQGIGRALCQYAERLLESRGYTVIILWVFEGNPQARRFYEAMGFRPDGAAKTLHPGVPLEAIRYRKELDK
jgi:RimJ/RimL family protein N-acetyltransferase